MKGISFEKGTNYEMKRPQMKWMVSVGLVAGASLVLAQGAPVQIELTPGQKLSYEFELTTTYATGEEGRITNRVTTQAEVDYTVLERVEEGFKLQSKFNKFESSEIDMTSKTLADQMKAQFEGLEATFVVSPRGKVTQFEATGGAKFGQSLLGRFSGEDGRFLYFILPEQPLTQGASWSEEMPGSAFSGTSFGPSAISSPKPIKVTYTVRQISGDTAIINIEGSLNDKMDIEGPSTGGAEGRQPLLSSMSLVTEARVQGQARVNVRTGLVQLYDLTYINTISSQAGINAQSNRYVVRAAGSQ
jgi:hypothetical protein